MWIVDDDGDLFNTDHFMKITIGDETSGINLWYADEDYCFKIFALSKDLTKDERLERYYDLVEKLTGVRMDEDEVV